MERWKREVSGLKKTMNDIAMTQKVEEQDKRTKESKMKQVMVGGLGCAFSDVRRLLGCVDERDEARDGEEEAAAEVDADDVVDVVVAAVLLPLVTDAARDVRADTVRGDEAEDEEADGTAGTAVGGMVVGVVVSAGWVGLVVRSARALFSCSSICRSCSSLARSWAKWASSVVSSAAVRVEAEDIFSFMKVVFIAR